MARLPAFDVVTFGTPHVIDGLPRNGESSKRTLANPPCQTIIEIEYYTSCNIVHWTEKNPTRAFLPKTIGDIAHARGGDYIQQLGIGGTDFFHSVVAWQSWISERRLRRMLEPNIRRRDLPRNLMKGHRLSLDGHTLLIDYPASPDNWNSAVLGHGVYTRPEWLPFHLREIGNRLYSETA